MTRRRAIAAGTAVALLLGLSSAIAGSAGAAGVGSAGTSALAPAAAAEQALRAATSGDVTITRDQSGKVHFVGTKAGHPAARPSGISAKSGPAIAAQAHLDRYAALFGIKSASSELSVAGTARSGAVNVVRFAQHQGNVPVLAGELVVSVDADGNLVSINGETGATAATRTATVSAGAAASTAKAAVAKGARVDAGSLRTTRPTLWIYDPALIGAPSAVSARPVWRLQVGTTKGEPRRWTVLIDANSGGVALAFADLAHAKSRRVCDFDSDFITSPADWSCPSGSHTVTRTEGQGATGIADVDNAYELTGAVYDYYFNVLGRDSIDDAGLILRSSVRVCVDQPGGCPFQNAFWDGAQMVFGEGFASADDVVGHELTHGVTEHESNLLYYFQSGAMNESMSDVIGELFDLSYAGPPTGDDTAAARWLLGEDLSIGAIRDMENPPAFGQPDMMSSGLWETSADAQAFDNGGVHTNSGVGNKAAFLMTDGGSFNGVTVGPINDTNKVAKIWYATDQLLTSGADYADMYRVMQQACANLAAAGTVTTADCANVKLALDAVEMSEPANETPIPQARRCAIGFRTITQFVDKFDRTSLGSAWTKTTGVSTQKTFQPSPTAGRAMFISDVESTVNLSGRTRYSFTTSFRTLSATRTTFLHFDHAYSLDWLPNPNTYFDGARVEIDVNGDGKSWLVPSTTAWNNGPNHLLFSGHPTLPGARMFTGESRGWTSSRLSLASYKGKQVKIRFRMALDGVPAVSAGFGWWMDNVRLYRCSAS
jgi:Zn-dependent metalloprotease